MPCDSLTPGWAVIVTGNGLDLRTWQHSLKQPFDPWIEHTEREGGLWALRSRSVNRLTNASEVRAKGLLLIRQLNGAIAVTSGAEPLSFSSVLEIQEGGKIHRHAFVEGARIQIRGAFLTATVTAYDPAGQPVPPPPPQASPAQRWINLAEANDDVADMLVFAGRSDNWFDIYKCIELARKLVGGTHKLEDLLGRSFTEMSATANYHRHARPHSLRHKLTDLDVAKPLLSRMVHRVMEALS